MTVVETEWYQQGDFILRFRPPIENNSHGILILLHGWTGDENVMWIFNSGLPKDAWILAPRGTVSASEGGYGWVDALPGSTPDLEEFRQASSTLLDKVDRWCVARNIIYSPYNIMGFSQGAMMAYATSFLFPQRTHAIVALAAYFPPTWLDDRKKSAIRKKSFYVAHGRNDQTVPVAFARQSVDLLEKAGASVSYCESDAGHKLSMGCLHGLEEFFTKISAL